MKIKLAEALLRRKELQQKVDILKTFKNSDVIYNVHPRRIAVNDSFDEVQGNYPKLEVSQVTAEYDYYARALRLIDANIQQINWTAEVEVSPESMNAYKA